MIRVAAYQGMPKGTFESRKEQIVHMLKTADKNEIDFLCFPEGFLTGYYVEREAALQNSLDIESLDFQEWLQSISSCQVTAIVGFNERKGDKIFDSAAIIEQGRLLGIQRKHYVYHDYFASGSQFSVYQSKGVVFGIVICLDANYFEPSRMLALQGASILFSPLCNKVVPHHTYAVRPTYYSHFTARSHENKCWFVSADWIWSNDGATYCPGHSVIYDPDGRERARSTEGIEQLLTLDIQKDQLFHTKGRRVLGSALLAQQLQKMNSSMISRIGVYGVVIQNKKLLVVKQTKGPYMGKWELPGGGVETEETVDVALRREFSEEVGMTFETMKFFETITTEASWINEKGKSCFLHQTGHIYLIDGLSERTQAELEYAWIDPQQLDRAAISPFVAHILRALFFERT